MDVVHDEQAWVGNNEQEDKVALKGVQAPDAGP